MAEYKGKKVTLNKPRALRKGEPGYGKKRKVVFVKGCSSESSRVKRITFGDAKLGMHKNTSLEKNHTALEVAVWAVQPTGVVLTTGRERIGIVNMNLI